MITLKKIVASSIVATTVLSMVVAIAPVKAAVATAGDLIKQSGNSSVYYLGSDSKRYVFPNQATYMSWYSDFSMVKVIPQDELEGYGIGGNVTVRPGTKLVKITTNPKVYAVEPGGNLKAIADEASAKTLYGADWAKRVIDVPDAFFINYKDTGSTLTAGKYPAGSLVKFSATSPDVYYVNADGTASKIASEGAFTASRFQFENVLDGSAVTMPALGAEINGAIATDLTSGAAGTVFTGGSSVTVALSGTTAASASVIIGQAAASMASFNLTAASDGAVKVTSLKLKRTGISADASLKNVYLYEGNTRLTDAAAVASGIITFTNAAGIVSIPAGQTKTLTVKADIAGSAGVTIGVAINAASDITTDGASVNGSFPAAGNLMSTVSASLAGVSLNTVTNPTSGSVNPGDTGVVVWSNNLTVATHDVNLKYLRLREIGSISSADLKDFELYVGGVKVAGPVQMSSDFFVAFDLAAAPVKIAQGNKLVEVRASVVNGSSKSFSFSLRNVVDIVAEDVEFGVAVSAVTGVTTTFTPATTGTVLVEAGKLSVIKKADSPSGTVTKDTNNVTLGKYTLTAFGESVKIETLTFGFGGTNTADALRNGKVMANGAQIGSTANLAKTGTSYTVNYTVVPGSPVTIEIVADMAGLVGGVASTTSVTSGSTVQASMLASTGNAQALTSLGLVSVPSATAAVPANSITVQTGTIALAKTGNFGNQVIVAPQSNTKLGSYVLTGNSTEDVTLNSIVVDFVTASGTAFAANDLTDVYVKYGTVSTTPKPTVATTSNNYSISTTLAKNASLVIEIWGTVGADVLTDSMQSKMIVSGTTVNSGQSVQTALVVGQTIAAGTGVLAVAFDNTPKAANLIAAQTKDVAVYKFSSTNNSFNIDELKFSVTDQTIASNLIVKDGTTVIATVPVANGVALATGLVVNVPANATKKLTVALELGTVGSTAGLTGAIATVTLTDYKATGAGQAQTVVTGANIASSPTFVYKTLPTFTLSPLPTTILADGTQTVAKFTIAADAAGSIGWSQLKMNIAISGAPTAANFMLFDSSNTQIGATVAAAVGGVVTFTPGTEQTVSTSETYTVKATIAGTAVNTSVSTSFSADAAHIVSAPAADGTLTASTFVWSDQSANGHALTTADWAGSFLVKNFPTDSQTMSK